MRGGGNALENLLHRLGQAAQAPEPGFVTAKLGNGRQLAMHEQMGDFLELAGLRDVEDVVSPIREIVARAADGAKRGVARGHTRERNRLLRFRRGSDGSFGHGLLQVISSPRTTCRALPRTRGSRGNRRAPRAFASF